MRALAGTREPVGGTATTIRALAGSREPVGATAPGGPGTTTAFTTAAIRRGSRSVGVVREEGGGVGAAVQRLVRGRGAAATAPGGGRYGIVVVGRVTGTDVYFLLACATEVGDPAQLLGRFDIAVALAATASPPAFGLIGTAHRASVRLPVPLLSVSG
jgi:hypothetical protein